VSGAVWAAIGVVIGNDAAEAGARDGAQEAAGEGGGKLFSFLGRLFRSPETLPGAAPPRVVTGLSGDAWTAAYEEHWDQVAAALKRPPDPPAE
jgi:hypothetical protein